MATGGRRPSAKKPLRAALGLSMMLSLSPLLAAQAKDASLALLVSEQGAVSRLTLDVPKTISPRVEMVGDAMLLRLPKGFGFDLGALGGRTPRGVAAITALPDGLRIEARPGMRMRHQRIGERIVVEVTDRPADLAGGAVVTAALQPDAAPGPAGAALRLAALQGIASDAPAGLVSPHSVVAPPEALLAQAAPQLPPMPAAARTGFNPAPGRQGPFGGSDGGGRPGLTTQVQAPGLPNLVQPPPLAPAARQPAAPISIQLDAGSGRLVQLPAPAFTIMAADPRVVRVQPASPTSIFLMGVTGGRTNIIATAEDGSAVVEYDVTVVGGTRAASPSPMQGVAGPSVEAMNAAGIESMIRRLVRGGGGVRVANLGNRGLVLSGLVPSAAESQRAEAIAKAYAGEGRPVINSLGLLSSIQVNLRVRVAEMSRTVTRDLGFNWAALASDGAGLVLGMRTGSVGRDLITAIAGATTAGATDPGRYAVRYTSSRFDINGVVDALAGDNLISILAEPNLTAQSGETASFLAGGEFPVPVNANPLTGTVGIEFKQFGISLGFVPTVLSPERLNLRVRPEVSDLTDNGAISMPLANGVVRIPALAVRRAETTIEVGTGQSFAIAGLLSRNVSQAASSLIGLGDIPVLGALFRSDRFKRQETELVIIVTPYLVRPVNEDRQLAMPTDGYRPATDLDRIMYRRQLARGTGAPRSRLPADTGFIVE
jgi:pilus assembly protein CpaC